MTSAEKKRGFFGVWDSVQLKLEKGGFFFQKVMTKEAEDLGKNYVGNVQKHIDMQDLSLAPLAESTVAKKGHETILYDTGEFKDKLTVKKEKKLFKVTVYAGALESIKYKGNLNMKEIATIIEMGSYKMPSRPIFRLTREQMAEDFRTLGKSSSKDIKHWWKK